jgi:hypothetical protein
MEQLEEARLRKEAYNILEWAYGEAAANMFKAGITCLEQRAGQSFMNVLRIVDQTEYIRLAGTNVDPFYVDAKLPLAIDKLTSK